MDGASVQMDTHRACMSGRAEKGMHAQAYMSVFRQIRPMLPKRSDSVGSAVRHVWGFLGERLIRCRTLARRAVDNQAVMGAVVGVYRVTQLACT
jgi:hypothetical protein